VDSRLAGRVGSTDGVAFGRSAPVDAEVLGRARTGACGGTADAAFPVAELEGAAGAAGGGGGGRGSTDARRFLRNTRKSSSLALPDSASGSTALPWAGLTTAVVLLGGELVTVEEEVLGAAVEETLDCAGAGAAGKAASTAASSPPLAAALLFRIVCNR